MNADDRSFAVVAAEAGAGEWGAAAVAQRAAPPDHTDFYALAGELATTLDVLNELTRTLGRQVAGYGQHRALYDDTRELDPHVRLAEAVEHLAATGRHLRRASRAANDYWSAIGHIGIEDRP